MTIKIYVAGNEQKEWTEEELGYPTVTMPTKAVSGHRQFGDYYAERDGKIIPIIVERKALKDAYPSFVDDRLRARLYREIDRYNEDDRFQHFVIIVEATEAKFMRFMPYKVIEWHQLRNDLPRFAAITRKKKGTVIDHLRSRGAIVIFVDGRQEAAQTFSRFIKGW